MVHSLVRVGRGPAWSKTSRSLVHGWTNRPALVPRLVHKAALDRRLVGHAVRTVVQADQGRWTRQVVQAGRRVQLVVRDYVSRDHGRSCRGPWTFVPCFPVTRSVAGCGTTYQASYAVLFQRHVKNGLGGRAGVLSFEHLPFGAVIVGCF
jgi:hypothetical protein